MLSGKYEKYYQIDPKDSWMLAAAEKNLPIVVPGWEDATLGNMYAAAVIRGDVKNVHTVRTGIEYMTWLAEFYTRTHEEKSARHVSDRRRHRGRFSDLRGADAASGFGPHRRAALGLFLPDQRFDHELRQLFSGAVPNEKITWGKLGVKTPKYIIESDATIVAPLIFAHVLGW